MSSFEFFRGFVRNPKGVGYVVPSSRSLARDLLAAAGVRDARVIVELGAGTGVLTRELLRAMSPQSTLVALEIDSRFASLLRREIRDPRLQIYEGSAVELDLALDKAEVDRPEVIISGIPFSTLPEDQVREILSSAHRSLGPGGRFCSYQFRDHARRLAKPYFGEATVQRALWNLPPMRIYTWSKPAASAPLAVGSFTH